MIWERQDFSGSTAIGPHMLWGPAVIGSIYPDYREGILEKTNKLKEEELSQALVCRGDGTPKLRTLDKTKRPHISPSSQRVH